MAQPGCTTTRSPIKALVIEALAPIAHWRPMRTFGSDDRAGADHGARPDLGARPDHRAGIHRHAAFQARGRMDKCPHRDAARLEQGRRPQRTREQLARYFDERAIGLTQAKHRNVFRRALGVALGRQAGAGAAGRQLRRIFRLVEECEIIGSGAIDRRDAGDAAIEIGAGTRLCARERGDLAHGQSASPIEEKGLGHPIQPAPPRALPTRVAGASEFRSATEAELLHPVVGFLRQRERIVKSKRSER